jgi:iron-sulfur cluster insertion protein
MQPKAASESTVRFSDAAAARVRALTEENKNPALKLRVFVSGGGCSGFQYGFEFDENVNDGDLVVENGGATMLVDAMSVQYLNGAEIDFVDGLEGSRFVINNPNASSTCGCGASFSV